MRTLVVEDDFTTRKILQNILSEFGACDVAVDGQEALTAIHEARKNDEPYDLICLDIVMPNLDGHEVLKQVRKEEEALGVSGFDGVKIIMVTGQEDKTSILSAFREGCEAYITKPIDRKELIGKIRVLDLV